MPRLISVAGCGTIRANPDNPGGVPLKLAIGCGNVAMVEHLLTANADPRLAEGLFRAHRGETDVPYAEYVLQAGAAEPGSTLRMLSLLDGHGWTVCRTLRGVRKQKGKASLVRCPPPSSAGGML